MSALRQTLLWCLATVLAAAWSCSNPVAESHPLRQSYHDLPAWSSRDIVAYVATGYYVDEDTGEQSYSPDRCGIWAISLENRIAHRLVRYAVSPSWTADGLRLTYELGYQIWTCEADGSSRRQLTFDGRNGLPDWHPDGRTLAWTRSCGDERGVWVGDAETGESYLAIPVGGQSDWWPDGESIVYVGWRDGVQGVFRRNLSDGSDTALYLERETTCGFPKVSPQGTLIAFSRGDSEGNTQIWIMDADGSNLRCFTSRGGNWPSWSPDGSKLVYTRTNHRSDHPAFGVLWVSDVVSGESYQLTYEQ